MTEAETIAYISTSSAFMKKLDTLGSERYAITQKFSYIMESSAKLLQIVPKQSAILTAYPNNGIHATHTGMTRFKTAKDTGYVRVHDQLWLWYNMAEESQDNWKEKKEAVKRQQQRLIQPTSVMESDYGESLYSGPVFNAPISGHNVISGTRVTGAGTTNFNFS